jgi:hypothetical protein
MLVPLSGFALLPSLPEATAIDLPQTILFSSDPAKELRCISLIVFAIKIFYKVND